ncbi:hypothetical protein Tco_1561480 [Tanacetum coccineum]
MAAPGGANQIARRVIDDLIEFSDETSADGYMSFFKNLVGQLNALIAEMEALEDQGKLFDTLMDLRDDREAAWIKLQGLNNLITQTEQEIETKEAQIQAMNGLRYGSILNILQGRNELLEKIIGCVVDLGGVPELDPKVLDIWGIMETEANDPDDLVNYDNDNDIDNLGYESEVYLDKEEEDDENNNSNGNVVKRGITKLSKFHKEYRKPDGIKLSVTFDALNRISWSHRTLFSSFLGDLDREHIAATKMAHSKSVYQHTMGRGGYAHVKQKMIKNKEIEPDEEAPSGIMWLKGRVNKDRQFLDYKIRSVGDKLKETEDKIKEGTLKVDHGTDAITVVLGKEKGGYARGVGSGVTYKRYFDLPRSKQAADERILLLQSQLDAARRERQEKELLIQSMSSKMSQTEGLVTKLKTQLAAQGGQLQSMPTQLTPPAVSLVDIHPVNSSADEEGGTTVVGCDQNDASIRKEMQKRETVKSVGAKKTTRSIRKDSSSQDSQSKENVSVLPQGRILINANFCEDEKCDKGQPLGLWLQHRRCYDDKFLSIMNSLLAFIPLLGSHIKRGTAAMSVTCKRVRFLHTHAVQVVVKFEHWNEKTRNWKGILKKYAYLVGPDLSCDVMLEVDIDNMTLDEYLMYEAKHRDLNYVCGVDINTITRKEYMDLRYEDEVLEYLESDEEIDVDVYYILPPLNPCFQTPQPCTKFDSISHNGSEEVFIDNITLEEYELYELAMSKKESEVVENTNVNTTKEKEEVHVEDVEMDEDHVVDHLKTKKALQWCLAKDP